MSTNELAPMIGRVMKSIVGEKGSFEMVFLSEGGECFRFWHEQDCCERVCVEDVCGDISDLIGSPIVTAEEVSSDDEPALQGTESCTWTFYRFATVKGTVTVRWLGESNGYYSESVSFEAKP